MSPSRDLPRVGLVWAQARGGAIGRDGTMPWHLPEDLAHFREVTMGAPVLMGRRTWESLPERFRPLPGRRNVVLTRDPEWASEGAETAASLDDALTLLAGSSSRVWVIGGGELYASALERADLLEVTEIDAEVEADTFAPPTTGWRASATGPWQTSRTGLRFRFVSFSR